MQLSTALPEGLQHYGIMYSMTRVIGTAQGQIHGHSDVGKTTERDPGSKHEAIPSEPQLDSCSVIVFFLQSSPMLPSVWLLAVSLSAAPPVPYLALDPIFGNDMVLPATNGVMYGIAPPHQLVRLSLNTTPPLVRTTTADGQGAWRLNVSVAASFTLYTITVDAIANPSPEVRLSGVMFGEIPPSPHPLDLSLSL
jgi:hypothetical protein